MKFILDSHSSFTDNMLRHSVYDTANEAWRAAGMDYFKSDHGANTEKQGHDGSQMMHMDSVGEYRTHDGILFEVSTPDYDVLRPQAVDEMRAYFESREGCTTCGAEAGQPCYPDCMALGAFEDAASDFDDEDEEDKEWEPSSFTLGDWD